MLYFPYNKKVIHYIPERGFFIGKTMKKVITFLVVLGSLGYYTALPFFVANAGGDPVSPANTVSTSTSVLYLRVTAYASVPDETSDHPFITASGQHVRDGIVASNILPFGTKIQIPALFGNKIFTVEDRTSPRYWQTVDLWMPSVQQAID